MQILIISSPWALFESFAEKSTTKSSFSVIKGKSDGNVLPLSIHEHCFAKKEFKTFFEVGAKFIIVKKWWYTRSFSTV